MSQTISFSDARDLLSKLLTERIPLRLLFISPTRARVFMPGFVDSISDSNGLGISTSGPPVDAKLAYFNFRPFDNPCTFLYEEKRELPEDVRASISTGLEDESVLTMFLPDSGEKLFLFFTVPIS
jgi:hypothetical protein